MSATPYKPVSFGSESLDKHKLQQMANNDQWLFENTPRIRYQAAGIIKDSGVKIISGKTQFPPETAKSWTYIPPVYFGSFFTAGCKPVIVTGLEGGARLHRARTVVWGLSGREIDHTGFNAVVSIESYPTLSVGGWVHWTATGF